MFEKSKFKENMEKMLEKTKFQKKKRLKIVKKLKQKKNTRKIFKKLKGVKKICSEKIRKEKLLEIKIEKNAGNKNQILIKKT